MHVLEQGCDSIMREHYRIRYRADKSAASLSERDHVAMHMQSLRLQPVSSLWRATWLALCMASLRCLEDSRCALVGTGASQVANRCVQVISLGGPLGDLQLVTLVVLIALARTYGVALCIVQGALKIVHNWRQQ